MKKRYVWGLLIGLCLCLCFVPAAVSHVVAAAPGVAAVQAEIDALPDLDAFYGMSREEQRELYDRAQDVCDAYEALGLDSWRVNAAKLEALMEAYAVSVQPVATDYGIYIAGEKVTSDKTSGSGWVYNPSSSTLTLKGNIIMTQDQMKNAPTPRQDGRMKSTTVTYDSRFVPMIYVTNSGPVALTISVEGNVTIGDTIDQWSASQKWCNKADVFFEGQAYRACGIYAENKRITVCSSGSGRGSLNISTNDLGIYCGELTITGVNVNAATYNTSALYAASSLFIMNDAYVTADTNCLGSLYGSAKEYDDSPGDDGFVIRYDSLATVFVGGGAGPYEVGSFWVDGGSSLHVTGTAGIIRDDYIDYRSETEVDTVEKIECWEDNQWKYENSSDMRPYAGIFVANGTMMVDSSTTTVRITAKNGMIDQFDQIRHRSGSDKYSSHWNAFLFRMAGVWAEKVILCGSNLTITMGEDGVYRSCGQDFHGIFFARYKGCFGTLGNEGNYEINSAKYGDYKLALYNASCLEVNSSNYFYTYSGLNEQNYSKNQDKWATEMDRLIHWSNTLEADVKTSQATYTQCSLFTKGINDSRHTPHNLNEVYYQRSETMTNPGIATIVFVQRKVWAKDTQSDLHLRKNGDQYEACYKSNFPENEVVKLNSNVVDLNQWTCANIYVFNDTFYLKARRNDDVSISVGVGATVYYQMSGGTYYDSTLHFYANGDLHLEGDGILRELQLHPAVNNLTGIFYMDSGTVASGNVRQVRVALRGGHLHAGGIVGDNGIYALGYTTRDGKQVEGNYFCVKNVVKLDTSDSGGANALLEFDASGLSVMNPFGSDAYNTTGIYPIDGELWFWRPYQQETYVWEEYTDTEGNKHDRWRLEDIEVTYENPYVFHHLVVTNDEGTVGYAWPKVLETKNADANSNAKASYVLGLEWKTVKSGLFEYHKNYNDLWNVERDKVPSYYVTEDTSTPMHSFFYASYIEVPNGSLNPKDNPIVGLTGNCFLTEHSYALPNNATRNNTYVVWELALVAWDDDSDIQTQAVLHYSDKSFEWTPASFKWDAHEEQYCGRTVIIPAFDYSKWKNVFDYTKTQYAYMEATPIIRAALYELSPNQTNGEGTLVVETYYNFHMLQFDESIETEHYLDVGEEITLTAPYNKDVIDTWPADAVTWYWQVADRDGQFRKISNSKAAEYKYKTYYNSATDNSYGYRFRRVIEVKGGEQVQTTFYSPVHTIYLGAAVEATSPNVTFQENDPRENFTFTFNVMRGKNYRLMYRPAGGGTAYQFSRAAITTAPGTEAGVTVVTVTISRDDFEKENGYWDRDTFLSYEFFLRADSVLELEDAGTVEVTPADSAVRTVDIYRTPHVLTQPNNRTMIHGRYVYNGQYVSSGSGDFYFGFGGMELTDTAWWEYTSDGVNWVKVTTEDTTAPLYIERSIMRIGEKTIWSGLYLYVASAEALPNGARVRGVMQDEFGTYYSNEGSYLVIDLPEIVGLPEDTVIWQLSQAPTFTIAFDYATAMPEGVQVSHQWQYLRWDGYVDLNSSFNIENYWVDIQSDDTYTISDRSLTIKKAADGWANDTVKQYRCVITITVDNGTSTNTVTLKLDDVAICLLRPINFQKETPEPDKTTALWEGDDLKLTMDWELYREGAYWQFSRDNGATWETYTAGTANLINYHKRSELTIPSLTKEMIGWQFRCVVSQTSYGTTETGYSGAFTLPRIRSEEVLSESEIAEALEHGSTVKLMKDITLTGTWVINQDTTLDLNGHYLTGGDFDLIKVTNNATLTIIDSDSRVRNEAADGSQLPFYGGSIRDASQRAIYVESGTVHFNGGTIYHCTYHSAIELAVKTRLVINGGNFTQCITAVHGLYDKMKGATIEMQDGEIFNCHQAIRAEYATVSMSGGSISACNGASAIQLSNGQFTMSGGTIENCITEGNGAALWLSGAITVTITGGTISNCTATGNGGAIYFTTSGNAAFEISGLTIESCSAKAGGAIYTNYLNTMTISNTTISNCSATGEGGAIFGHQYTEIVIGEKVVIEYCSAAKGGAICSYAYRAIQLTDTVIRGCTATDGSGAIWTKGWIIADGGIADGGVTTDSDIKKTDPMATMTTSFYGKVSAGNIEAGLYYGEVTGITKDDGFVTVTYKNNNTVYATAVIAVGALALQPEAPEDTRTLIGWYLDKTPYQFNMPVTEDLVLVARWAMSDGAVADLTDDLAALEEALDDLQTALEDNADPGVLQSKLDALTGRIEALEDKQGSYVTNAALESKLAEAINTAKAGAATAAQEMVDKAKEDLQKSIDEKADSETVNGKLDELNKAIAALEKVKDNYAGADETLKKELNEAITAAKSDAVKAAEELVKKAKEDLQKTIDEKADSETVNGKLDELNKAIAALEKAKDDYADADKALEEKLRAAIAAAQEAAVAAAGQQLEKTKGELQEAIDEKADTATVNEKVEELRKAIAALEEVKDDYADSDATLEAQLAAAERTLHQAIEALDTRLSEAEQALEDLRARLEAELAAAQQEMQAQNEARESADSAMVTALVVVGVVFAAADGGLAVAFYLSWRKRR